jgi:hypothetical protein
MTSKLQPPNVSINKPFKHLVHKRYDDWLNKDNHIMTPSGKIRIASAPIIVQLMSKGWKEVPVNIIPKSFLKCCLYNAEDGTQDGILWDDREQSGKSASSSVNESVKEEPLDKLSD